MTYSSDGMLKATRQCGIAGFVLGADSCGEIGKASALPAARNAALIFSMKMRPLFCITAI